jgi:hypothetical protein
LYIEGVRGMKRVSLQASLGIAKSSIEKVTAKDKQKEDLLRELLSSDIRKLAEKVYGNIGPGTSRWATWGKRVTALANARFALNFFVREGILCGVGNAIVVSGQDAVQAALPWISTGLATDVVAVEKEDEIFSAARSTAKRLGWDKKTAHVRKLTDAHPGFWRDNPNHCTLHMLNADILSLPTCRFDVVDLDFCNNVLRTEDGRREVRQLIQRCAPVDRPSVLSCTIHIGRSADNTRQETHKHSILFEKALEKYGNFMILAKSRESYQSNQMPMANLVWIIERR